MLVAMAVQIQWHLILLGVNQYNQYGFTALKVPTLLTVQNFAVKDSSPVKFSVCVCELPESLCDVTSWWMVSLSVLSPPPAPPLPRVSDSCRLIFLILSMSGGRGGRGGRDAEEGGAASLDSTPGYNKENHHPIKTMA